MRTCHHASRHTRHRVHGRVHDTVTSAQRRVDNGLRVQRERPSQASKEPEGPPAIAASAYDLVALAAILGSQENGPKFDQTTLTSESGFAGVGGLFRFLNNGSSERSLEIREVQNRGSRVIDPARKRFGNNAN